MKKSLLSFLALPLLLTGLTACDPPLVPPGMEPDPPHPHLDQYAANPDTLPPPPPPPIVGQRN